MDQLKVGRFAGVTTRLLPKLVHASHVHGPVGEAVKAMAERVGGAAFLRQQRAILDRPDSRPTLGLIRVPTLVAVGADDLLTPPALAREIHQGIAGSRLLVQNSVRERFVQRVTEIGASARKGDPMQATTNIGPVTTPAQYQKILDYMRIAKDEGARCVLGGGPATDSSLPGGQFVEPTIFVDVTPQMRIYSEETFGPVKAIVRVNGVEEAVACANDNEYGLSAAVFGPIARS